MSGMVYEINLKSEVELKVPHYEIDIGSQCGIAELRERQGPSAATIRSPRSIKNL
jgi:hypothetical protein